MLAYRLLPWHNPKITLSQSLASAADSRDIVIYAIQMQIESLEHP